MNKSRVGPYFNRSFSNGPSFPSAREKPSFSSLFADESNDGRASSLIDPFHCVSSPISDDDDGIHLQISNLDHWYDETNLRNYLMNQLKPITPILSLTIETPSIARVKVPSTQVRKISTASAILSSLYPCSLWFSSRSRLFRICIARKWDTSASLCRS